MFTGLVEQVGHVVAHEPRPDGARLRVQCATPWATQPDLGASICCSGVCLTAIELDADSFTADVSNATFAVSTAGTWTVGTPLNLETSLTLAKPLGGHLVTGHVDGVGRIESIEADGDNWIVGVAAPVVAGEQLSRLIARKGSITIDGVSLTVNAVEGAQFAVNIIPHTRAVTTLGNWQAGAAVNLEVDLMARYAARLVQADKEFDLQGHRG